MLHDGAEVLITFFFLCNFFNDTTMLGGVGGAESFSLTSSMARFYRIYATAKVQADTTIHFASCTPFHFGLLLLLHLRFLLNHPQQRITSLPQLLWRTALEEPIESELSNILLHMFVIP